MWTLSKSLNNYNSTVMKRAIILIVAIIAILGTAAQDNQPRDVELQIHKINFIPLAYSFEARVANSQTVFIQPSLGFSWVGATFFPAVQVTGNYRYYYNFDKRAEKGKRTAKNSANYVGAMMNFSFWDAAWAAGFDGNDYTPYWAVGPVWGIQRNYKSHFSLGLALGPMLTVGNKGVRGDAYVELTLGFWLGK